VPAVRVNQRTILVSPVAALSAPPVALGLYARVSSHDQKADLDRQVARLSQWAAKAGHPVERVEAEVGSGMNGSRTKLRRLLADPKVSTVVVEHRDRLARMNTELVEAALAAHGRRLVVIDDGEVTDDLVRDMVEVLTSFCARLYGRRSAKNRAEKALRCAAHNVGPMALMLLSLSSGLWAGLTVEPQLVAGGEFGVVVEAALELGEPGGPGAECLGGGGQADAGCCAGGTQIRSGRHGRWCGDQPVDLAGDVALQAAHDLPVGLALGASPGRVSLSGGVAGEADHDDAPQGVVGLSVAAPVEPVAGDLA